MLAFALLVLGSPDYSSAANATLRQIKSADWTHLAASIDPKGVLIGELEAANLRRLTPAQFRTALASSKKLQWTPPMEVEGGDTAPAYTASLKSFLQPFRARDWAKGKVSFGKSIDPGAYRTLYLSDLQPKAPKARFVEYYFGSPKSDPIFDAVLMLGYTKVGSQYRLSVLAQDSFKD